MTLPHHELQAETTAELLLLRAFDDRPGLRFEGQTWTWKEVVTASASRAAFAQTLFRDGPPHIAVLLDNEPEYVFWLGAAALAGAVIVGMNPTRRGPALADDLRRTDAQLLVTNATGLDLLAGSGHSLDQRQIIQVDAGDYAENIATYRQTDAAELVAETRPTAEQLLLLLFTSGTTGQPKAVRCSQGRLAKIAHFRLLIDPEFGPDDVALCLMPMFHGNALMLLWAPSVLVGATIVVAGRFSASRFASTVRQYGVTRFNYVGKALAYVLDTESPPDQAHSTLIRGFGTEGTVADRAAFERRFNCVLVEGYGSSEGGAAITATADTPLGALGRAEGDVVVIDPATLAECPPAEFDARGRIVNAHEAVGEIVNREGAAGFEGYYKDEAAVAARTRNGWYWTGDLAYRDVAGFFYFAGRTGDWMRVDSENITAGPIERILLRHEDVAAVAVYAVPDASTGDQVMAAIELRAGRSFDAAAFAEFIQAQTDLGTKSSPKFIRIAAALPQTATGRLVKDPLRRDGWWKCDDPVFFRPDRAERTKAAGTSEYVPLNESARTLLLKEFRKQNRDHLIS